MSDLNNAIIKATTEMLKTFNNRLNKSQREDEQTLAEWAKYLTIDKKFTVTQVGHALKTLMNNSTRFMPSAYEIEAELTPKETTSIDIGNFVANEIIQKVIDLGIYRLSEVYESLSDVSKTTLGENRYILTEIANSNHDQLPSIRAQIRDMAKSAAEIHKQGKRNEQLEKIGLVLDFKKPEMRTMDYSGYLPSEPA